MDWWIIEDALCDRKGHWFEYIQTFRDGLLELGECCEVYTASNAEGWLLDALNAKPLLPPSIWHRMGDGAPKWKRLLRIPGHAWATYRHVSAILSPAADRIANLTPSPSNQTPLSPPSLPDVIFVPTVLVHHLLGWWRLITGPLKKSRTHVLLFFPNAPIHLDASGTPYLNRDPTARLFVWLIRKLASLVHSGKVTLGAETEPMVAALTSVTGVPFTYLPHPVRLPRDTNAPTTAFSSVAPLMGAYGAARHEKGSDILQLAIRGYLKEHSNAKAHFALQWLDDFDDDAGRRISKDPWLGYHSGCTFITEYFKEGGYMKQVVQTAVMLLPYRKSYALRVSRVVIEALIMGIPVIATRGTTLFQQAEQFGAAVPCSDGSVESLKDAIADAVEKLETLQKSAQVRATTAQNHFSVWHFRELLLRAMVVKP